MPFYDTRFGKVFLDSENDVEAFVLGMTKKEYVEQLKVFIDYKLEELTSYYPKHECNTWSTSLSEAKAYVADPEGSYPFIEAAALASGVSVSDLAAAIITNANTFATQAGEVIGLRIKGFADIEAATSLEELNTIRQQIGF